MEFNRRTSTGKPTSPMGYAIMIFGMAFLTQLFYAYNLSYYTSLGLITLYWAGICKIIFTVVDWLDDLAFGALSERTHSKWGKRIPWLLGVFFLMPLFVILTYAVDKGTPFSLSGFILYYLLISIFQEFTSTAFYTNYSALFPTLFRSTDSRSKAAFFRHILEILGVCLCYILTPIFTDDLGFSFWEVGLMFTGVYVVCYFIGLRSININDDITSEKVNNQKYSFKDTLKDCLTDAPFIIYNLSVSCFSSALAVAVSLYPLYCEYVLDVSGWQQAITMGSLFIVAVISIPLWYILVRKKGFIKTWLLSYGLSAFALFLLAVPNDFISGTICASAIGLCFGGLLICPDMIGAEIIDIDKIKHHVSREAAIGSVASLVGRFIIILSTVVSTIVPSKLGYVSGTDVGPNPAWAFKVTLGIILPCFLLLGFILAIIYVKISKKERMALHELKRADSDKTTELDIRDIINETRSK